MRHALARPLLLLATLGLLAATPAPAATNRKVKVWKETVFTLQAGSTATTKIASYTLSKPGDQAKLAASGSGAEFPISVGVGVTKLEITRTSDSATATCVLDNPLVGKMTVREFTSMTDAISCDASGDFLFQVRGR